MRQTSIYSFEEEKTKRRGVPSPRPLPVFFFLSVCKGNPLYLSSKKNGTFFLASLKQGTFFSSYLMSQAPGVRPSRFIVLFCVITKGYFSHLFPLLTRLAICFPPCCHLSLPGHVTIFSSTLRMYICFAAFYLFAVFLFSFFIQASCLFSFLHTHFSFSFSIALQPS